MVVIENGLNATFEGLVIGNLHNHIVIGALLRVEVPNTNSVNCRGIFQIDLNPLRSWSQLNEVAFFRFLVTVSNIVETANNREIIAG